MVWEIRVSIIRCISRVKWSNPGKYYPPLHLSVVAIEKGPFGVPLTTVTNITYFIYKSACVCMCVCVCVCVCVLFKKKVTKKLFRNT